MKTKLSKVWFWHGSASEKNITASESLNRGTGFKNLSCRLWISLDKGKCDITCALQSWMYKTMIQESDFILDIRAIDSQSTTINQLYITCFDISGGDWKHYKKSLETGMALFSFLMSLQGLDEMQKNNLLHRLTGLGPSITIPSNDKYFLTDESDQETCLLEKIPPIFTSLCMWVKNPNCKP